MIGPNIGNRLEIKDNEVGIEIFTNETMVSKAKFVWISQASGESLLPASVAVRPGHIPPGHRQTYHTDGMPLGPIAVVGALIRARPLPHPSPITATLLSPSPAIRSDTGCSGDFPVNWQMSSNILPSHSCLTGVETIRASLGAARSITPSRRAPQRSAVCGIRIGVGGNRDHAPAACSTRAKESYTLPQFLRPITL